MADRRRSSTSKILDIVLDSPPNYVYTSGEIISGRVTLRSSSDEDVYSIVLQLTGTGESHVNMSGGNNQQLAMPDAWSNQVFLDMHQQLYQGSYKLRKDVTYEWPFKMRFPDSKDLIPTGVHGKHQLLSNGDTSIYYELKASRATSEGQAKALLEKAVKGQEAGIKSKIRGLTAATTTVDIKFISSRPSYVAPEMTPTREVWSLPLQTKDEAGQAKFTFKSLFKAPPTASYTVRVDLPKSFVQFERLPAFIRIMPKFLESDKPSDPGPVTVEKVEFVVSMRVRHKASGCVGENLEQITILKLVNPGIVINGTGRYDIGGQYNTHKFMWPTFNSDVVETRHNLRAHVTLNASGRKFNDIFTLLNCNVYPQRVAPSPLNHGYICNFFSQASTAPSAIDEKGEEVPTFPHQDVIDAFFAVSQLLTAHKISPQVVKPHDPSAVLALLLPGQANRQLRPQTPIPEGSKLTGSLALPDPRVEDKRRLSSILRVGTGLESTTSQFLHPAGLAYIYGGQKSASQVRLEIADPTVTAVSSSIPPPSYSSTGLSSNPTPPPAHTSAPALTPNKILTDLLHRLVVSDAPSPPPATDSSSSATSSAAAATVTIAHILYLCQEYSAQLLQAHGTGTSIGSDSSNGASDARQAVLKHPELRRPLVELAGVDGALLGAEVEDEPTPRVLTKEEARFERRKELANKVGYWSPTAQKREQVYSST